MVGIGAPSIRLKAFRLPPSSRIATFSVTPISLAFATAAFSIFCASSKEILCFFATLAIGFFPPFKYVLPLDHPALGAIATGFAEGLVGDHSSVHCDGSASHVRSICRSNKGDHVSDLIRFCQTLHGYCRDQRQFVFICTGEAGEHSCIRSTRSDYVYPNSGARDFQCSGFCQALYRMLAGHVNGRSGSPDASVGRRDIDDAPAPLWQHHPQFMLHAEQRTQDVCVEGRGVGFCSLLSHRAWCAFGSSIVDRNIQTSETLDRLIHKVTHVLILADVSTNKNGLCSEPLKLGS